MRLKLLLLLIFEFLAVVFCIQLFGQGTIQLTPGSQLKSTGGAYLVLNNMNLVNNGTIQQAIGDGTFKFTGNNLVQLSGSGTNIFDRIQLDKLTNSPLELQTAPVIIGQLQFVNGLLDLKDHFIDLGSTGILFGEWENSHAVTTGTGYIQATKNLNVPSTENPGNLGAVISSSQNLGIVVIRRGHKVQNGTGMASGIARYYDVTPVNNNNLNATFRFTYLNAELNNLDEATLQFYKSDNLASWIPMGFDNRSITQNYVEKNSIQQFSRWTLSAPGVPLPVTSLVFSGEWTDGHPHLHWSTQAEYNNDYFDMERKYAYENVFAPVGRQLSKNANGNAQTLTVYNRIDSTASALHGPIQYRLRQVDRDGHFRYSDIILIRPVISETFISLVYPTMLQGNQLFVQTGNMNLSRIEIKIYDASGKLISMQDKTYQSQWLTLPYLAAGLYEVVITSAGNSYTTRVVKR